MKKHHHHHHHQQQQQQQQQQQNSVYIWTQDGELPVFKFIIFLSFCQR